MITLLINILGLACFSFLFAKGAEPIQLLKEWLNIHNDATYVNGYQYLMVKLLNCSLCSGFWIGLIFTFSFYQACIISILAELITIKLSQHN